MRLFITYHFGESDINLLDKEVSTIKDCLFEMKQVVPEWEYEDGCDFEEVDDTEWCNYSMYISYPFDNHINKYFLASITE